MSRNKEKGTEKIYSSGRNYGLAASVLAFIVVTSWGAYYIGRHGEKHDILSNPYPLVDPARELISQDYFLTNVQPLRDYLISIGKQEGDNISIYYEQLNSGANISINKDLRFYLASLEKLPVAMIAMKKLEEGEWNVNTDFKVEPQDIDTRSGNLYKNTNKASYTFLELLNALLIDSDNTANNVFVRNFKLPDFQSIVDEIGLDDVYDAKFMGSAKEYSRILRSLYTSSYLKRASSEKILELMAEAKWKNFLSQGIPSNIKFAHKYGESADYFTFLDSGIVYVPHKPYMITVLYKGPDGTPASEAKAEALMKEISQKAYELSK